MTLYSKIYDYQMYAVNTNMKYAEYEQACKDQAVLKSRLDSLLTLAEDLTVFDSTSRVEDETSDKKDNVVNAIMEFIAFIDKPLDDIHDDIQEDLVEGSYHG